MKPVIDQGQPRVFGSRKVRLDAPYFALMIFAASCLTGCARPNTKRLSFVEYGDKVYASWLGQCVGNMYGIPHEFQYNDEPRTEPITGWAEKALERIRDANGAFSDDDTDIEYVDLYLMEKHGVEPTYENVAEFWKLCINRSIWVANESARKLMDQGYLPPLTGRRGINPNWFKIDPQLVCEIWAVTAPGMLDYAAAKADWAAKVTNDDYGTHPTIWYNVMYAAAFFETDVEKLCQTGYEYVPEGSPFRMAIDDVRAWKAEHGDDWVAVRQKIKAKYVDHVGLDKDIASDPIGALLNGALGVLALLYGEGDFEKTLHLACMAGYDADNQAATLSGLIALSQGSKCIPDKYLYILDGWEKPLNDFYKNKTRDHLPDSKITEIARRTADLGVEVVVINGGRVIGEVSKPTLVINTDAKFVAPVEARLVPHQLTLDQPVTVQTEIIGGDPEKPPTILVTGALPPGLSVQREQGRAVLKGAPTTPGRFDIDVVLKRGDFERQTTLPVFVNARNLARSATQILAAVTEPTGGGSKKLNVIRQELNTAHYDSYDGENELAVDYYGYEWKSPIQASRILYVTGPAFDNGGWFKTLTVQFRHDQGEWQDVKNLKWNPSHSIEQDKRDHTRFTATFDPIETTGIRIIGAPGGTAQFTSIRQLDVYER